MTKIPSIRRVARMAAGSLCPGNPNIGGDTATTADDEGEGGVGGDNERDALATGESELEPLNSAMNQLIHA